MIIPIQREGAVSPSYNSNNFSSTSPTTYTTKKSVRVTPKITEVEILPRQKTHQPEGGQGHSTKIPVSILSSSKSTNSKSDWNDLSALKMFETNNKRWVRGDDLDDFLLPSLTSPNLLKDKFDTFSNRSHALTSMPVFRQMPMDPIKIDTFVTEADRYVLTLDVQQFKPDEIAVKVTDDTISVTGKHEEKQNEGNFSFQQYARKHTLPAGVKADDVKCVLSLKGILTITAPRKELPALQERERTIPIKHSGLPAIRV